MKPEYTTITITVTLDAHELALVERRAAQRAELAERWHLPGLWDREREVASYVYAAIERMKEQANHGTA